MPKTTRLIRHSDGKVLLPRVELARTFWSRFVGLQFRRSLPSDQGLFLKPCSSLHSCFMRFPIDVIMLDHENRVLKVRRRLPPWRAMICVAGTVAIIETAVDALELSPGDQLSFEALNP
jgi:uncharacterized membrane protein (UPF0127 family)